MSAFSITVSRTLLLGYSWPIAYCVYPAVGLGLLFFRAWQSFTGRRTTIGVLLAWLVFPFVVFAAPLADLCLTEPGGGLDGLGDDLFWFLAMNSFAGIMTLPLMVLGEVALAVRGDRRRPQPPT